MEIPIEKQIGVIVQKMELVKKAFGDDKFGKVLSEGAVIARDAIAKEAPSTKKKQLKEAIQVFQKRRTKGLYVLTGPVAAEKSKIKRAKGGPILDRLLNAFYWRFVYYGAYNSSPNRFIERARSKSANAVLQKIKNGTQKFLKKKIRKLFK